jgi:hypothetical protein
MPSPLLKSSLKNWHIALFVLSGTIIRFLYAKYSHAWMAAPDQLAWELSLDEMLESGHFSYNQMIHYPHEGGSFLLSLLALCLRPFEGFLPSLSLAALLFDTGIRYFQIWIAGKMFGHRMAVFFGIWTILAVPLLIPWSLVNFGLHYLASIFPFVLLYFVRFRDYGFPNPWLCGLIVGLSISFAYDNLVLIPAYFVWILYNNDIRNEWRHLAKFLAFVLLMLILHFVLRIVPDNGFHLENLQMLSIRGIQWSNLFSGFELYDIFTVWYNALPASFFLSSGEFLSSNVQRWIVMVFCLSGLIWSIFKPGEKKGVMSLSIWIILIFILAYTLSPFFTDSYEKTSYIYYRHLAYILPLLVLVMIHGLLSIPKIGFVLVGIWVALCGVFSITYMISTEPKTTANYRASGWILARKYGDDPKHLIRLHSVAPFGERKELMIGFGWGLTATLMDGKTEKDTAAINQLMLLAQAFPAEERKLVFTGVEYAFSDGITPVLDQELLPEIERRLKLENK